jgi:hypothetical protein
MMWKEVVVVYIRVLFWHLPGRTEENYEKPVKIMGVPTEIQTRHLPNTIYMCYCLSQSAPLNIIIHQAA